MAIDVFSEKMVSLSQAIQLLPVSPRNKKLHVSTLHRWVQRGLRSKDRMVIHLETVKIGGITFTSQEALQRFFERLSGNNQVVTPVTMNRRQRLRQIEQAQEELRREGI